MKPTTQYVAAGTTALLFGLAILLSAGSSLAQGITGIYVLEDNGWYENGGADFPRDPFFEGLVRGVEIAWVRVERIPSETPFTVTSSNPGVFSVEPAGLSPHVLATITEPAAPTQVTVRANTVPPTIEKSAVLTVYPSQRVEQVRIIPERPFHVVGEKAEIEVTMRYAEPFPAKGRHVLALRLEPEPKMQNMVYVQYQSHFGGEFGSSPVRVSLPSAKVFRLPMSFLKPGKQTLKVSVMCAVTELLSNMPYDRCHTDIRTASYEVVDGPRLEKIVLNNPIVAGGAASSGRVDVSALDPASSAEIALSSSDPSVNVPATVTLSGSGLASTSFPITTTMAPGDRTVTIKATQGNQETSAVLTVQGVLVKELTVAKPELRAEESFDLVVTLDRPAPGPVTVALTSSDPRAVRLPAQLTFNKGEQRKTVSVSAGTATKTTDVRLSGSIAGTPARDAAVRIVASDGALPRATSRKR